MTTSGSIWHRPPRRRVPSNDATVRTTSMDPSRTASRLPCRRSRRLAAPAPRRTRPPRASATRIGQIARWPVRRPTPPRVGEPDRHVYSGGVMKSTGRPPGRARSICSAASAPPATPWPPRRWPRRARSPCRRTGADHQRHSCRDGRRIAVFRRMQQFAGEPSSRPLGNASACAVTGRDDHLAGVDVAGDVVQTPAPRPVGRSDGPWCPAAVRFRPRARAGRGAAHHLVSVGNIGVPFGYGRLGRCENCRPVLSLSRS